MVKSTGLSVKVARSLLVRWQSWLHGRCHVYGEVWKLSDGTT